MKTLIAVLWLAILVMLFMLLGGHPNPLTGCISTVEAGHMIWVCPPQPNVSGGGF